MAQGRQLLHRYFPLSVTVGWKFVVATFVAIWLVAWALADENAEVRGWASALVLSALNIAMFWRIGMHLGRLAREPGA